MSALIGFLDVVPIGWGRNWQLVGADRPVAPGVGLAAYRIVQEALTNSLRHADAQQVRVCVEYGTEELHLEVCNNGLGQPRAQIGHGAHHGRGFAGMRERATVCGGDLHAGPEPGGGYAVRALLSIERISS